MKDAGGRGGSPDARMNAGRHARRAGTREERALKTEKSSESEFYAALV